jgi:predicted transcriptional regulator
MTPQKAHYHTIENLVDNEGGKSPLTEVRKMIIRLSNVLKVEFKEDLQKQLNESQENMNKKFEKTQRQLNEIKDVNKL